MYVLIEETRNKKVWVDADDFDSALAEIEGIYLNDGIDMHGNAYVRVLVGDEEHDFCEIDEFYELADLSC